MQFNEIESRKLSENVRVTLSSYQHTQTQSTEYIFNVRVVAPNPDGGFIFTKEGVTFSGSQCKKIIDALDRVPIDWSSMGRPEYFTDPGQLITIEAGSLALFCMTDDSITINRIAKLRSGKVLTLKIDE